MTNIRGSCSSARSVSSKDGIPADMQLAFVGRKEFSTRYGHVEVFLLRSNHNKDSCAYLHQVYIKPFYRKKGYGAKLVRAAWKWAKRQGCYKMFLVCRPELRRFYEAAGLAESGIQMQKLL